MNDYNDSIKRISCRSCDYLLVQCAKTGKVIEAYAPGVKSHRVNSSVSVSA